MVEIVAQDGPSDGLQFGSDFDGPNIIHGLPAHHANLTLDGPQLPYRKAGETDAEQHQSAEARIETTGNPEEESWHLVRPSFSALGSGNATHCNGCKIRGF